MSVNCPKLRNMEQKDRERHEKKAVGTGRTLFPLLSLVQRITHPVLDKLGTRPWAVRVERLRRNDADATQC